ncbi:hypothetical protein RB653_007531 [Dictyostelium firmibasis]|uniref:Transmembrane protein n=1 Tax=Dictyostelium firmibasis TaxID=79012 RepID=A0AAN7TNW2_9MYCE
MIKSIVFLFFISLSFAFSQQLLQIQYYQYEAGQCDGSQSQSGSLEACSSSSNVVSTVYAKFDECLIFNDGFSILSLASSNSLNYSVYENDCNGPIVSSKIIELGSCSANCENEIQQNPFLISIVDQSSIEIPSQDSFATIYYGGDCDGDWKNSFSFIQFMTTNLCVDEGENGSMMLSCNPIINQLTITSFNSLGCKNKSSATEIALSLENCNLFGNNTNMGLYCN